MIKTRYIILTLVAALAIVSLSDRSYGEGEPPPAVCYPVLGRAYPRVETRSLTYDTRRGVALAAAITLTSPVWVTYDIEATVPLQLGDEPNPHFDRLYSLLMKGADNGSALTSICVDRVPTKNGDAVQLVSATVDRSPEATKPQKVQICSGDGERCAGVNYSYELSTTK